MHSSEEHEQDSALDLVVSEDVWRDGRHQTRVQLAQRLHLVDAILLSLGKRILGLLHRIAVGVRGSSGRQRGADVRLRHHTAERGVRCLHGMREEAERVGQIAHSELLETHHSVAHLVLLSASSSALESRVGHGRAAQLRDVGHDDQRAREHALVTGLGLLHHIVAKHNLHAARHGASGNLVRVLLDAHKLPVAERRQRRVESPALAILARGVQAVVGLTTQQRQSIKE